MTQTELKRKLEEIKNMGYVQTMRKGPTGVGYTFESLLGLTENNIAMPDIGGRIEIKATRKTSTSLITLFTFNRGVWQISLKELVENYGYIDPSGRKSIYCTVSAINPNPQGLKLKIRKDNQSVNIVDINGNLLACWSIYSLVGKFLNKLNIVLFVTANTQIINDKEYFYFDEAYLLQEPVIENFIAALEKGILMIDIRIHLKENDKVRNHGTGIRIHENDLPLLYKTRKKLL
ncbi:MvaI/BcnI family restriction endonuclease [Tepidanaerobacter syntrophicus]|uniref:MvaI/BcnI family restriction endonuclease n=1 Tax=Tepidanaerobacter syntrophicus TaxID=224999 RepID=UPI001BD3E140|nr:MvaI/BcnI family restriction endonuclease [Tepidanaerobacter syntrophicus]